jgi:hypothetical protein
VKKVLSLQESFPDCKWNELGNLIKCLHKGIKLDHKWITHSLNPDTYEYTQKNKPVNYTCSEGLYKDVNDEEYLLYQHKHTHISIHEWPYMNDQL